MKEAAIEKTSFTSDYPELKEISSWFDKRNKKIEIDTINWPEYNYTPEVDLAIAYSDLEIFLKFYITEKYFKAEKTESNQMVCEDSCVEFFVSPANDGIYYNMEFNGIGTCLLGSGTRREDNKQADPAIIKKIRRLSSAGLMPLKEKEGQFSWTLTLAVPFRIFFHHNIKDVIGKTFRANFYKCGDKTKVPHYVTWSPVDTVKPDYHQPEYFGKIKFV
jgi:hypothetical protein